MEKPTPRINSLLREKYVGSTIRIAGKVVSVSPHPFFTLSLFLFSQGLTFPSYMTSSSLVKPLS
jgi:hypothetical protein